MSDPSLVLPTTLNRHTQVSKESKKTHFKLSPSQNEKSRELQTTQRLAYQHSDNSSIVQPTINAFEFKRTHFKLGFQKPTFETSNSNNELSECK